MSTEGVRMSKTIQFPGGKKGDNDNDESSQNFLDSLEQFEKQGYKTKALKELSPDAHKELKSSFSIMALELFVMHKMVICELVEDEKLAAAIEALEAWYRETGKTWIPSQEHEDD
jgi:hypothetical protein